SDELSPMGRNEAALIRQTAMKAGYSKAEARHMEQSVINAQPGDRDFLTRLIYAHLHRHQDPDSQPDASALSDAAVSGPASPGSSEPSPTSAHAVVPSTSELSGPAASRQARDSDQVEVDLSGADQTAASRPGTAASSSKEAEELPGTTGSVKPASARRTTSSSGESSRRRQQQHHEDPAVPSKREAEDQGDASEHEVHAADNGEPKSGELDDSNPDGFGDSSESDKPVSWRQPLDRAITGLHDELAEDEQLESLDETRLRASLGLLQVVAQNPEKAMVTLEGLDEQQLEFWRQTMMGLDVLMDADGWPKMRYRVEAASDHLQRGLSALKTLGPLQVNNLSFVSDVRSFGVYDEIGARGFDPGEQVILYVEIGNFTVGETAHEEADLTSSPEDLKGGPRIPMYETELVGRYDILDQEQRIVMSRTLPVTRDRCRNHRRDFFVAYEFHMPREIDSGYYRLELTIEDRKGSKFGSGSIEFRIR
ncbi:MAG: hypothetical protein ACOC7K_02805, partial [bacterium]